MNYADEIRTEKAIIGKVLLPNAGGAEVYVKREDLTHPALSGNKWRKLKYNLIEAERSGIKTLLTFGGAFSNHIYAVAAAGKLFNFKTIGIIRGEERLPLNSTLQFAEQNGMKLNYLPRGIYRNRNDAGFQKELASSFGECYIIPEGGSNLLALNGIKEMMDEVDLDFDIVVSAVGSGGTAAGIIAAIDNRKYYIGIPVLKNGEYLNEIISGFLRSYAGRSYDNWRLETGFHCGGFAKMNKELADFIFNFETLNDFKLDPIYTAKMFFAVEQLIASGKIPRGVKVLTIHTGGLQGRDGMTKRMQMLLGAA